MCELHPLKCPSCKRVWTARKKLASCERPDDAAAQCPESLCLIAGNPKRPAKSECDPCREVREMLENMEEDGCYYENQGGYGGWA